MTSKNTVTLITPPDLHLNYRGPLVLFLGFTLEQSTKYSELYEKLFPDVEINFYVSENGYITENNAWYRAVSGIASSVFVNIDNITIEELFLAMQIEQQNNAMVFWISENDNNASLLSLINSYHMRIFRNTQEIEDFLIDEIKSLL